MCVGFCTERREQLKNKFPTDTPDSIALWKAVFLFLRIRKEINVFNDHIWRTSKFGWLKEHKSGGFRKEISAEAQWNKKDTGWSIYCSRIDERWWTLMDGAETVCPPGPKTKDDSFTSGRRQVIRAKYMLGGGGGFGIVIPTNSNLHEAVLLWQTTPFFCSEGCSELLWLSGRAQGVFMSSSARDECFHLVHPSATLTAPSPPPPVDTGRCYAVDAS